jgi:hypothetical protein
MGTRWAIASIAPRSAARFSVVKRQNAEGFPTLTVAEAEFITDGRLLGEGKEVKQRVDHEVPNEVDKFAWSSFSEQILDRVIFRGKEIRLGHP